VKSDDDIEGSGSGSEDDDHSASGADLSNRHRSFYNPPDVDYGLSFDIFSRPPVEVVTRRWHGDGDGGHVTVPVDTSRPVQASLHLLSLLLIVTHSISFSAPLRCCC